MIQIFREKCGEPTTTMQPHRVFFCFQSLARTSEDRNGSTGIMNIWSKFRGRVSFRMGAWPFRRLAHVSHRERLVPDWLNFAVDLWDMPIPKTPWQAAEKRAEASSEALRNVQATELRRNCLYARTRADLFFSSLLEDE